MKVLSLKPTIVKRFCVVAINWPFDTLRCNPLSLLSPNVCKLFNAFVQINAAYLQSRISIMHIIYTPKNTNMRMQKPIIWWTSIQPCKFSGRYIPNCPHSTSTKTPHVWPPPLWVENRVITPGAFRVSHPGCASKFPHFSKIPRVPGSVGNGNQWWLGAVGFFHLLIYMCFFIFNKTFWIKEGVGVQIAAII